MNWILWVLIGFLLVVLWYMFIHSPKALISEMAEGVKAIKLGLYYSLCHGLLDEHDPKQAGLLAAAVVNSYFGSEPATDEHKQFREQMVDLVVREMDRLANDPEVRAMITDAVRVDAVVRHRRGELPPPPDHLEALLSRGWINGGGPAPDPKAFRVAAITFLGSVSHLAEEVLARKRGSGE